ncbi:MAG: pyridoxal phosphate-dependent decarboxylase family protein [Rhodothermales bacterium]
MLNPNNRETPQIPSPLDADFEHDLDLYFLGPKSEQRQFLYEALQLVLNDHVFWRRNYWPKDPPAIGYSKVNGPDARHFREMFFTELFSLVSDLKLDVPVFSPRYMAHMISETTLPALVAYFATLLYNPNNVSSEASPVTIRYELEVGKQFARLFGFDDRTSFGHLTSGGTIANYESLWFHKAGRFLPVAIEMARRSHEGKRDPTGADALYELLNVPLQEGEVRLASYLGEGRDPESQWSKLESCLISHLGDTRFIREVEAQFETRWIEPVVIVPRTAHYCWRRSASLLGIGRDNFLKVAAYGGYFATIFQNGEASDPSPLEHDKQIRRAFRALSRVDSVTVDPHKAGYIPYGAGSIVIKHGYLKDLVAENAPYCLDRDNLTDGDDPRPQLGKFILEGSKPGAVAASVWFSHRLIPLDNNGYGRQLSTLCRIARRFDAMTSSWDGVVSLFRPHTNIVCLVATHPSITTYSGLNALNEHLAARFGVRDVLSIQSYDYLVSRTTVASDMPVLQTQPELAALEPDTDALSVMRLVFMNRWVELEEADGNMYLEDFLVKLRAAIEAWAE